MPDNTYRVLIHGIECYAYHGVPAEERVVGHRYRIDLELTVEGDATLDDEVSGTVDYGAAGQRVLEVVQTTQFRTVERLAFVIASDLLDRFGTARTAKVRVTKPLPPAPLIAESAGVEIFLERE